MTDPVIADSILKGISSIADPARRAEAMGLATKMATRSAQRESNQPEQSNAREAAENERQDRGLEDGGLER